MMQKKSAHKSTTTNYFVPFALYFVPSTFYLLLSTLYLLLSTQTLSAQDLHFSQLFFNPQNLNPAEIGFFDGNIRANAVIRNQWKSIPVPYQTNVLAVDFARIKKLKNINVGLLFNNDKSGDSRFIQNQFLLGISKLIKLNTDSTLLLSVGCQNGIFSNSFQTQNLSFDSQFNGTLYDSNLPNGENFNTTKSTNFNSNIGGLFAYRYSALNKLVIGFSANQLVSSKLSFYGNNAVKTNPKLLVYFRAEHFFSDGKFLLPYFAFLQREKNKEIIIGSSFGKKVSPSSGQIFKPYLGIYFRNKDSYFFQFGTFYNQFNFALSYDVNYSKLKTATNNRGAIEFILIYIFKKPKHFVVLPKYCPVFL